MNWLISLFKELMFGKTTSLSNADVLAMFGSNPSVEVMQRVREAKLEKSRQDALARQAKLKKVLIKMAKDGIRDTILRGNSIYTMSAYDLREAYGSEIYNVFKPETFAELAQPGLTINWVTSSRNLIMFKVH